MDSAAPLWKQGERSGLETAKKQGAGRDQDSSSFLSLPWVNPQPPQLSLPGSFQACQGGLVDGAGSTWGERLAKPENQSVLEKAAWMAEPSRDRGGRLR